LSITPEGSNKEGIANRPLVALNDQHTLDDFDYGAKEWARNNFPV